MDEFANMNVRQPASLAALGAALRRRRRELGLTLDAVADATGISKPYLSNIETARAPGPPSEEKLRRIARALRMPAADLLAAADWLRAPASIRRALRSAMAEPPRRDDNAIDPGAVMRAARPVPLKIEHRNSNIENTLPLRPVPVINRVAAGRPAEFTDLDYPLDVADEYVMAPEAPGAAFAVRVEGDSMLPEYAPGELLIVGPGEPRDGDDCVVRLGEADNFATTFKRIHFVADVEGGAPTEVRLAPLNAAHQERRVRLNEVTGIYPLLYRLVPPRQRRGE